MHVRLVAIGSHGDVLPILALAVELKRRGRSVTLAAPAPFAKVAEKTGIPFHALGTVRAFEDVTNARWLWHPRKGVKTAFDYYSTLTEPTYRWLADETRPGDAVVGSTLAFGARLAQDRHNFPTATVHVIPMLVESRIAPPIMPGLPFARHYPPRWLHLIGRGIDRCVLDPATLPALNLLCGTLGLEPVRRLRYWWNSWALVILMFPDWYASRQADWPAQAVQVNFPDADRLGDTDALSPALEAFLAAGEPPLAFTYGSAMRAASAFFETAVRLCRRMGRRGILLTPQSGQVPASLPEDVIHVPYAPFSVLLPHCAALVHHGGIGTVAQALRSGIPQCVVPVTFNHFDDAARLVTRNLGASLAQSLFTPALGARTVERLLASPRVARACAEAKDRMRAQDGVPAACDAIERLTR